MSQEFIQITEQAAKGGRIVYGLSRNVYEIAKRRESKSETEGEKIAWRDLMTRSQWCFRWMDRKLYPLAQNIIYRLGGRTLPKLRRIRLLNPISFTVEPCNLCKKLEASFAPNDKPLRKKTKPFWTQHHLLFETLVWGAYAVRGSGLYFYEKLNNIRGELTEQKYIQPLQLYDTGMKGSEDYLAYGRQCFSRTEIGRTLEKDNWRQRSRVEPLEINIEFKYTSIKEDKLKAVSGLYALNPELLCKKCRQNVEPKPIKWGE